jgi:hypothetical protein
MPGGTKKSGTKQAKRVKSHANGRATDTQLVMAGIFQGLTVALKDRPISALLGIFSDLKKIGIDFDKYTLQDLVALERVFVPGGARTS